MGDRTHNEEPTSPPAVQPDDQLLQGFGVVGGSGLLDTEAVSICMPVPFGEEAGGAGRKTEESAPRTGHANGIGRSAAMAESNSSEKTRSGYNAFRPGLRPDEATGKPGPLDQEVLLGLDADAAVQAAAANQERFVAAARAGEVGDLEQLFSRSGVRVDGCVDEGAVEGLQAIQHYPALRVWLSRLACAI